MLAIEHRFVAGLVPESSLWTTTRSYSGKPRWSEVHLAQSELDSGCGLHCLLMALMILLGLSRSEGESPRPLHHEVCCVGLC